MHNAKTVRRLRTQWVTSCQPTRTSVSLPALDQFATAQTTHIDVNVWVDFLMIKPILTLVDDCKVTQRQQIDIEGSECTRGRENVRCW